MRHWGSFLLAVLLLASCATPARYRRGMESAEIEAMSPVPGRLKAVEYPSSERRLDHRRMIVYLPEGYDADTTRRYPVLYLLHGARGNETTWISAGEALKTLDSLRARQEIRDLILVLPNANCYFSDKDYNNGHAIPAIRAFWIVDGEMEVHFMQDVVAYVDRHFRTIATKEGRAIAGMSTGGLQALYLSANNPDAFDAVGLFSAYAANTFAGLAHPDFYCGLRRKQRRQFAAPPSHYYIIIGRNDIFYPHMRFYDRRLTRQGYPHEMTVTPGGHRWTNWRNYLVRFYKIVYGIAPSPEE